jgi:hypothetical protein
LREVTSEQTHCNGDDCADHDDGRKSEEGSDAAALAPVAMGYTTSGHSGWRHLSPYADTLMLPQSRGPLMVYVRVAS